MAWSIIASIAAAISALFAAISALLLYIQNKTRYKIELYKKILTDKPQNIFNNKFQFAMVRLTIQNRSSHILTFTDCTLAVENKEYFALENGTDFQLSPKIELITPYSAQKSLNKNKIADDFIKFPLELQPYQFISGFILFPNFPNSMANVIKCKLKLYSLATRRNKKYSIYLHRNECAD